MKKSLKVLIASSAIMLGVSLLAGCEEKIPVSQIHEHTFSENWEASDSTHWHKATCEHTDVMSNVEDHKFGAWNTDKEPTQEAEGSKSRICTVCQYKQVAPIAKLDHTHVFAEAWSKDADYHWHDATCHSDVRAAVAEHTWGNWTTTVEPTETTKGLQERTCSVCGYKQTAEVDKTLHVHTYASEWSNNETSHWKAATCGHRDSFKDFGDHQFGEPVVVPSTETDAGSKTYTCGVCGYVKVENLPLAEHTHQFSNDYSSDALYHWHAATCGHEVVNGKAEHTWGGWDVDDEPTETEEGKKSRCCTVCGYNESAPIPKLAHTHVYSSQWSKNATEHWHAATCDHNDSRADVAEHTWDAWVIDDPSDCTTPGTKHRACSICGYVENAPAELNNEAHSFASDWTYNNETHWHAATCGHAVKKDENAHIRNTNYPKIMDDVHCTICGKVLEPAGKDATQYVPNDYVNLAPNSAKWFLLKLGSRSQIRIEFAYDSIAANKLSVSVCRKISDTSYGASNSFYLPASDGTGRYSFCTTSSFGEGIYYLGLTNLDTVEHNVMPYHYSYVFNKVAKETKSFTIGGETSTYKMYEYVPQYSVDASNKYVTIENESGDEVAFFQNLNMGQLSHFDSGSYCTTFSFRDTSGSSKTICLPGQIYRSEQLPDGVYGFKGHDENGKVYAGFKTVDSLKTLLVDDPYFKQVNRNISELNAYLYSWYAYDYVTWTPSSYAWDDASQQYVPNSTTYDIFGLFDIDFDEVCEEMTYKSDTEEFYFQNPTGGYHSMKITNTTSANYSLFNLYKSTNDYDNNTDNSSGRYAVMYYYIFDSNGYRVNDFRSYASRVSGGSGTSYWVADNYGWFFNATNNKEHRFEIKPGETYYIIDYSYSGKNVIKTIAQTTYTVDLNSNDSSEPETLTYLDGSYHEGAKYHKSYSVYDFTEYFLANHDVPEGKVLAGWGQTPNGRIYWTGSKQYVANNYWFPLSTITVSNKQDGTLYAKYMDAKDLIFNPYVVDSFTSAGNVITYNLDKVIDDSLVIKADDAVTLVYASSVTSERIITEVGYGTTPTSEVSAAEALNHPGEKPYVKVNYEGGIAGVHSNFLAMYMKQEFDVELVDNDNDLIAGLGKVNKGEAATLPFYGDLASMDPDWSNWESYDALFGEGGALEGKYFAGWSEDGTNIVTLDGGQYTPTKDTSLSAIYKAVEDSKVVALRYGIGFKTVGGQEYIRLTILDPNLTITTSTAFKLVMSNGETIDIGIDAIKTDAGVTLSSATSANNVILLKLFDDSQLENVRGCIQIIVA